MVLELENCAWCLVAVKGGVLFLFHNEKENQRARKVMRVELVVKHMKGTSQLQDSP